MQYYIIKVPDSGCEAAMEEFNRFLRGHQVLHIERRHNEAGGYWSFCVEYRQANRPADGATEKTRARIDYREKLSEEDFAVYCRIREWRNKLAKEENVAVYAIFTNEQLATMAERRCESLADLEKIDGVGEARLSKYGEAVLERIRNEETGADT